MSKICSWLACKYRPAVGGAWKQQARSESRKVARKRFPVIGDEQAKVDRNCPKFVRKQRQYETIAETYRAAVQISVSGADDKSKQRHVKHYGKLLVQERVKALVDDMDEFLELSVIAGVDMEYGDIPRAGVLTGIGRVMGKYCLIIANDGAYKGGAIFPITLKKQLRAQEIAQQNRLPCIYIVDSAGAFLPLQAEIFNPGGRTFYNEAVMSASGIPQVAVVCGSCTAGGAYVPTMADEAVIIDKTGTIFLGGPPLVQAALGEHISAEDLGGATLHCKISGCTDYFVKTEAEAFETCRDIVASLNLSCGSDLDMDSCDGPIYDIEDVVGIVSSQDTSQDINMYQIIARLVDGSRFHEFKALYGTQLLTGFAQIEGRAVGIIGNQGHITEMEATKGSHFVQLCCERDVPLLFLQNTDSTEHTFIRTRENAVKLSLALKCQARMLSAICCASVPKLTVIIGNGFGYSHYIMGGRAVSPNFLFAWPNAQVSIMNTSSLALALTQQQNRDNAGNHLQDCCEKYKRESSAVFGATKLLNDGIILPQETRKVLSQCLQICQAYRPIQQPVYPVFRM